MKKMYEKPVLNTKAYAQFENVFTACDNKIDTTFPKVCSQFGKEGNGGYNGIKGS